MDKKATFKVSVLLIQEGDLWSMQCLDYDIAAQGKTIDEAKDRFEKTFLGQIALDIKENREPFMGVEKAPQEFWEMFAKAEPPKDPRRFCVPNWILPGFIISAQANDLRVVYA